MKVNNSKINSLSLYEEICSYASEKLHMHFQKHLGFYSLCFSGWKRVCFEVEGISYFFEGKAYLECYYDLFSYIKNLIRSSSKYGLSKLIELYLE